MVLYAGWNWITGLGEVKSTFGAKEYITQPLNEAQSRQYGQVIRICPQFL